MAHTHIGWVGGTESAHNQNKKFYVNTILKVVVCFKGTPIVCKILVATTYRANEMCGKNLILFAIWVSIKVSSNKFCSFFSTELTFLLAKVALVYLYFCIYFISMTCKWSDTKLSTLMLTSHFGKCKFSHICICALLCLAGHLLSVRKCQFLLLSAVIASCGTHIYS